MTVGIFLLAVSGVFTGATVICGIYTARYAREAEYQASRAEAALQCIVDAQAKAVVARVQAVLDERRTEVAEREADGMLPFGTPGASWCDAVTVTCSRIEEALRAPAEPGGIPANPDQQSKENSA